MSNTYIKFKTQVTGVQKTPESVGGKIVIENLEDVIPIANPDFEDKIEDVAYWLIEFENDSYYPNREIGLDISDKPIIIMPWGKNYGYWTDNNLILRDFRSHFDTTNIKREEFERYWKMFTKDL